ncbi:hypothetical protein CO663_26130 [Rhizobium anhuiense]|nr:hypothetical protein CO663_26130 [Rhizobium anhuiense]
MRARNGKLSTPCGGKVELRTGFAQLCQTPKAGLGTGPGTAVTNNHRESAGLRTDISAAA